MAERPAFQQRQLAFTAHIRDPQHNARPADVTEPRMAVYRELIFNNLDSFLADTLPVLHGLLDAEHWHALIRDFLIRHRAHSPYFLDIPREFLSYLDEHRRDHHDDPPYLRELAHYEWVELALSVDDRGADLGNIDAAGDLLAGHPVLSPLVWPLQYAFPVHRISQNLQPTEPPATPTFLLAYRDNEDTVRFLELNPVSARLIGLLVEHAEDITYTGRKALETIASELEHPQPEQVLAHGLELLSNWRKRGIVIGTR